MPPPDRLLTELDPEADRDAWLEWRRDGIGASDIPAILGFSRYGSALTVYLDKQGKLPDHDNEQMWLGRRLEPIMLELFTERTGRIVLPGLPSQHWEIPWARATLDGLVAEAGGDVLGPLELKTGSAAKELLDDDIAGPLAAQLQWQMFVTDCQHAWAAGLVVDFGFKFVVREVERDEDALHDIIEVAHHFWHENVLAQVPPPATGEDREIDAINDAYRVSDDDLTAEVERSLYERYLDLKRDAWKADRLKTQAEAELKLAMGEASVGLVDGEPLITWKEHPRKGYSVAPSTVRRLTVKEEKP
jgi:putative phage-type endonuclease